MSERRAEVTATVGAEIRAYQRAVDAFDDAAAAYLGVNRTDLRCLDLLLERGQAGAGELGHGLALTTGSVTAMLDRLEQLGYVRRAADPTDRRRVAVRPTPTVLRLVERLWGPLAAEGSALMARYGTGELELLQDVLRRTRELQEAHTRRIRALAPPGGQRRSRA